MILAEIKELAPTPKEVICADARKDGQAMIVTKVKLSIHTSRIPVKGAIALGKNCKSLDDDERGNLCWSLFPCSSPAS